MTAMKKVFYILLFAWFGISCTRSGSEVGGEFSETEYYIQGYLEADMLTGTVCTGGLIGLGFSGELYLPSRGEKGDKFRELSAFYGDTHYNKPTYPGGPNVLCNEFKKIDIVSDKDFNEIPAGQSLGNVVKFLAVSVKPFLDSGYTEEFDWSRNDVPSEYRDYVWRFWPKKEFYPVYGLLSELRENELKLLERRSPSLCFLDEPRAFRKHTLTITLEDTTGRELSCTVEYDFDAVWPAD
ncbi:MAG TPA: hypothetical protein DCG00_08025 [Alistipes sp.]|nr:hypothetical protein [Alistipes sp.]